MWRNQEPEIASPNFIELFFADRSHLQLEKVVFSNAQISKSVISVPSNLSSSGESFNLFESNCGTVGAIIILLEAARLSLRKSEDIPVISGATGSVAEIFAHEVRIESEWIRQMFALQELQIASVSHLFQVGHFQGITSVVLNSKFFDGRSISVLRNGSLLSDASELVRLQENFSVESQTIPNTKDIRLKVVTGNSNVISDEVKHLSSGIVAPKILDIFSKKLEEQLIKNGVNAVKDKIDDLSKRELSYHLSQHTYIEMLPKDEWNISFEFEVINAGFLPISKRTHQYWFEHPQGEVDFDIKDQFGEPIKYTVTKASEKYREIRLELPRVLQALDRIKYKISYRVKGIIERDSFYYLSPRTLTKKLGLTVKRYDNRKFENARVSVECEGGFMKDNPPELIFENEKGVETIRWTQSSPRPGELYRTLWTNQETNWEVKGEEEELNNVIPFPDRPRS